jgi:hypothetical protein
MEWGVVDTKLIAVWQSESQIKSFVPAVGKSYLFLLKD